MYVVYTACQGSWVVIRVVIRHTPVCMLFFVYFSIRLGLMLFDLLEEFYNPNISKDRLRTLISTFFISVYVKNRTSTDLNNVTYILYQQYVTKQSLNEDFNLASLPPTINAAQYHAFRTFHQVSPATLHTYLVYMYD